MEINVFNNYPDPINFDFLQIIKNIAAYFSNETDISLILVNEEEIFKLNETYRATLNITDVLTFPADSSDYLGDIFICINRVLSQAEEYGHSPEREFAFLLIHGILHLFGYDHHNETDEENMIKKQEEILNELQYRRKI